MLGNVISLEILLIAIRKRLTEMVDSCGTLLTFRKVSESVLGVFTWKERCLRKLHTKSNMFPLAIILLSLSIFLFLYAVSFV